ncbi:MAG: hypothetical protein J6V50_03615 [Clostridia bacterium]|nr:hypothetical protein [Clostridia bacterium]
MSIRKIEIPVLNLSGPKNTERFWAGMQYEDNASEIVFNLAEINLQNALYRIDFNSATAGYFPSKNLDITDGKISRSIPKVITQYGGEAEAVAVITVTDPDNEEGFTAYSYPVILTFTSVQKNEEGDETVEGNISEIEESVRIMAEKTEENAKLAQKLAVEVNSDRHLTEEARFALEDGSEFIFVGGNAEKSADVSLVVDGEISDESRNPVQNKSVKAYVDAATKDTRSLIADVDTKVDGNNAKIGDIETRVNLEADYIIEQGTSDVWTYRKWNSGLAELWCATGIVTAFTAKASDEHYHGASFPRPDYPFTLYGTIYPQFSLYYAETSHLDFCLSGYKTDLSLRPPEFIPYMPWLVNEQKSVTGRYYVIGKWK